MRLTWTQRHDGVSSIRSQLQQLLRLLPQLHEELRTAAGVRIRVFGITGDGARLGRRFGAAHGESEVLVGGFDFRNPTTAGLLDGENHIRLLHGAAEEETVTTKQTQRRPVTQRRCSLKYLRMKFRQTMASGCEVLLLYSTVA